MPVKQIFKRAVLFAVSQAQNSGGALPGEAGGVDEIPATDVALAPEEVALPSVITETSVIVVSAWSYEVDEKTIELQMSDESDPLNNPDIAVLQTAKIGMEVGYAYSGVAGKSSALAPLFRACGSIGELIENRIKYSRSAICRALNVEIRMKKTATIDYRYRSEGMRGILNFDCDVGGLLKFKADFQGDFFEPDEEPHLLPNARNQRSNIMNPATASNITAKSLNNKPLCLLKVSASNYFGFAVQRMQTSCGTETDFDDANGELTITYKQTDWSAEFNPWYVGNRSTVKRVPFQFAVGNEDGKKIRFAVQEVQCSPGKVVTLENGSVGIEQKLKILKNPVIWEE